MKCDTQTYRQIQTILKSFSIDEHFLSSIHVTKLKLKSYQLKKLQHLFVI